MTVQVGVEWDLLEQEFPAIPCESAAHGTTPHHPEAGAATHYVSFKCPRCRADSELQAICQAAVALLMSDVTIPCPKCWRRMPARLFVRLLEPIKK